MSNLDSSILVIYRNSSQTFRTATLLPSTKWSYQNGLISSATYREMHRVGCSQSIFLNAQLRQWLLADPHVGSIKRIEGVPDRGRPLAIQKDAIWAIDSPGIVSKIDEQSFYQTHWFESTSICRRCVPGNSNVARTHHVVGQSSNPNRSSQPQTKRKQMPDCTHENYIPGPSNKQRWNTNRP